MAWQQDIYDSKFRGIPFTTTDSSGSHGRRGADHEFPGRDEPYAEDAGRRQRTFPVGGFIAGPDYLKRLTKMIAASEAPGAADLVHPYLGKMRVMCRSMDWETSVENGGMAILSFTLVEAGSLANPEQSASTASQVLTASTAALDAAETDYGLLDDTARSPYVSGQAAHDYSDRLIEVSEAVTGAFFYTVDNLLAISTALFEVNQTLSDAAATPAIVAARTRTAFEIIGSLPIIKAFTGSDEQQAATLPATATPEEESLQLTLEANRSIFQRMLLALQAYLLSLQDFSSYDEAIAERDALADLINAELLANPRDDVYGALVDLLGAMRNDINSRAQDLPRQRALRLDVQRPSLVIAQELYGDATRAQEIETRNNVSHPMFVAGDLLVLSE